jgi:hypothetical protein
MTMSQSPGASERVRLSLGRRTVNGLGGVEAVASQAWAVGAGGGVMLCSRLQLYS